MTPSSHDLFEQWLLSTRDDSEFARLCSTHPSLARELNRLREDYESAESLLKVIGVSAELEEQVRPILARLLPTDAPERYRTLRCIAETRWNLVEEIRDVALPRRLARKTLKIDTREALDAVSCRALRRMLREVATMSRLQHPGILSIIEFAIDSSGRPFFTMPLIDGQQLGARLPTKPIQPRELAPALSALRSVCDAIDFAHAHGVVHRDLKPENVMLGAFGEVLVVDWGLAKPLAASTLEEPWIVDDEPQAGQTMTGTVVGTPAYMAPEQASGADARVGPRSDQYALGAMLYRILTGQRPFEDGLADSETRKWISAVRDGKPTPVQDLAPQAPDEVVAICVKAMARDPADRYESVRAMAADLRAYLELRTVSAHDSSLWWRSFKWMRRNRAVVVAASVVLVVVLSTLVAIAIREGRHSRAIGRLNLDLEERLYERNIEFVHRQLAEGLDLGRAESTLAECPQRLRGFEWDYLYRSLDTSVRSFRMPQRETPTALAATADDARLAMGTDSSAALFDIDTGAILWRQPLERVRGLACSPDMNKLAVSSGGALALHSLETGLRTSTIEGVRGEVLDLSFSRNGRLLCGVHKGRGIVCDVAEGRVRGWLTSSEAACQIAISPSGRHIAVADRRSECRIFDARTLRELFALPPIGSHATMLEFDLLGQRLLGGSFRGQIWTASMSERRRAERFVLPGQTPAPQATDPSGTWLVHAHGSALRLRSMTHNRLVVQGNGHRGAIRSLVFLPSRQAVVSSSLDGSARLWHVQQGQIWRVLRGHRGVVLDVAFEPGGRRLAAVGQRGELFLWTVAPDARPRRTKAGGSELSAVAWSKTGIAVAGADQLLRVFDGKAHEIWNARLPAAARNVAWLDDARLAVSTTAGLAIIENRRVARLIEATRLGELASGADKVICGEGAEVVGRDAASLGVIWRTELSLGVYGVALSPSQSRVYAGDHLGHVACIDAADGEVRWRSKGHDRFARVAVSPDGKRVASCGQEGLVKLWDTKTGRQLLSLEADGRPLVTVAFSDDGQQIAAAGVFGLAHVWDLR